MKVLLIWEEVPKKTELYALEGELAELAIAASGHYINSNGNKAVEDLSEELQNLVSIWSSAKEEGSADITGFDRAVICGFCL